MIRHAAYGTAFGLLVGGVMRLPGPDAVVPAFAINLCVMAALWLGLSFAPGQAKNAMVLETGVAVLTFVIAAVSLRTVASFLLAGFALQVLWSLRHSFSNGGLNVQAWFPPFAAMANVGFILSYLLIVSFT